MRHGESTMKPFGTNFPSALAKTEFRNVVSQAIDNEQNLAQLLVEVGEKHNNQPAFTNLDCTLSFNDVNRLSDDLAAYLRHGLGLNKGDRVAIMLPNLLQYPVAVLGVLRADLIAVLINPMYTARELRHQLADSGASVLIVLDNFGAVAADGITGTSVKHVIVTRVGDMLPWPKSLLVNLVLKYIKKMIPKFSIANAIAWPSALQNGKSLPRVPMRAKASDTTQLQYTGGTTGVSKGAVLSHAALMANVAAAEQWSGFALDPKTDVALICLPIYHIAAYSNLMISWTQGYHSVLVTNPRDIQSLVAAFAKYRPGLFCGVNALFDALINSADFCKLNFSTLKLCIQGGTALRRGTAERWKQCTGLDVIEMYGLSETSGGITVNHWDQKNPVGSIGLPMSDVEVSIRDDAGNEVNVGEAGELCFRGLQVTTGYWNRDDSKEQSFFPGNWFRTGDVAKADEQGYLFLLDRLKDMILVSGFNVYPNEIEDVVAMLDGVLEVAAIGVPNEKCGEAVKLVVVRKDPALTADTIRKHCRAHLTGYKQPSMIEFRGELPKSAVGKILRRELRE
jgi:long-chain acyl-CoA synthetase